ncbi:vesicle transport protein GOT1 [Rutidosis leptorrhynchoides]|uniref:vesicle transport protein GOT1 n=1 Tax=Rutidosis leptorrhynchoides TaxID=125765 RepID=UPI003A9A2B0B
MVYELTEQKKIGLGLIGFGIFFTFLAILLFFDRGLLALGNVLWLTGVTVLLGVRSMWNLFTNRGNYKGTLLFLLGLFFLFVRWPVIGIIMETFGCFLLFGGFWPTVRVFLCQIPGVGWIIQFLLW